MVGVPSSNLGVTTRLLSARVGMKWFDKFAWSKFARPQDGPQGGGQDVRRNPLATTKHVIKWPLVVVTTGERYASNYPP